MNPHLKHSAMAFVIAVITAIAAPAHAQQLPDAPVPVAMVTAAETNALPKATEMTSAIAPRERVRVHRFFDRINLLATGVEAAALLTDGAITQSELGQIRTEYRNVNGVQVPYQAKIVEMDPVGKLFVNHGWAGTIAGGGVTLGADLGLRYWLHRTNHHRLERIVPFAIAASNAWAAWHDTRY